MKREKLLALLSLGEGQTVEFKRNYNQESVGKVVCSFLNSGGGCLVCGVDDKGTIVGSGIGDGDVDALQADLTNHISPGAFVSFEIHEIPGKTLLAIEAPSGKDVPYSFMDDIYVREGEHLRKADVQVIRDMVLRRQSEPERWERRFSDARLDNDLDENQLSSVAEAIRTSGRFQFHDAKDKLSVLEDLSVAKYGKLTNAGDLLFCSNTTKRYPQTRASAVRFTVEGTDDSYKNIKFFEGPALHVLENLYAFIILNIPSSTRFPSGTLSREDSPLYPAPALREGLVNSIVHRDYADFSGGLAVRIYPKRLEIWNSGELPEGITERSLTGGHISILRNPDIAHVFYLRGMMEKIGRGCPLILKTCADRGLSAPVWRSEKGKGVTLTFFAPEVTPEVTPEVARLLSSLDGEMSRRDLQEKLGLSDPDHFRKAYIDPALSEGLIERTIQESPHSPRQQYKLTQRGARIAREMTNRKENA